MQERSESMNEMILDGSKKEPEFISNDAKKGRKVLTSIEDELRNCDSFIMSVAFITRSGITPLLQQFKELEEKGVKGKILTTNYLTFSDPIALKKLASFSNIECKMYCVDQDEIGFHTKGYIFKKKDSYKVLIGSSNLTQKALTQNREWNTKIVSTKESEYLQNLFDEFNALWYNERSYYFNSIIDAYQSEYNAFRQFEKRPSSFKKAQEFKPNSMQVQVIKNLQKLVDEKKDKVLLISATGTGKTYASAFALKEQKPKRLLFLVHREQIALQAMKTYQNVFGKEKSYGLLSGSHRDLENDFLFSTMQMMAKKEILESFSKEEFDVIVIDEAHRSGAKSYQAIMNYFHPKLWFGMTASPERSDDFDVFSAFDHNIVYEIRLQQALEEDLLCPFHYFGISDLRVDQQEMDCSDFKYLSSDQRVDYILKQAQFYGYSGDRAKGLIFCSSKKETKALSEKMNQRGFKTLALSGEDSQQERQEAVEKLLTDQEDHYDYLLTVDIFNEGVDIPEINQVLLLRETQSPIVFVQQLGRGLRKAKDKEYVVILDFIGNYKNNYMIPIALSGDQSFNKDNIRRHVSQGERVIPGASTIHFDAISKKEIYKSIDAANFTEIRLIRQNYQQLKIKLGHIPSLKDFDQYGSMDLLRMFENKSLQSYYRFLVKYEKEYKVRISNRKETWLKFISTKLASGKRIHELLMIQCLMKNEGDVEPLFKKSLKDKYGIQLNRLERQSVKNILTNEFPVSASKKTFQDCLFLDMKRDGFQISSAFQEDLKDEVFYSMVEELIDFGIDRFEKNYQARYKENNLVLYQKYTYEDVCRLLNWEHNEVPLNIGGYKYDKYTNTFPVFINYDKSDDIQETIKYADSFLNEKELIAISKAGRSLESEDVQNFLHSKQRDIQVHLFVRKNKEDKESKEFYYLGLMETDEKNAFEFTMPNTNKSAVEMHWFLDQAVREDLYQYIVNG